MKRIIRGRVDISLFGGWSWVVGFGGFWGGGRRAVIKCIIDA